MCVCVCVGVHACVFLCVCVRARVPMDEARVLRGNANTHLHPPIHPPAHQPTHARTRAHTHTHTQDGNTPEYYAETRNNVAALTALQRWRIEHKNTVKPAVEAKSPVIGEIQTICFNPKSADHGVSQTRTRYQLRGSAHTCTYNHTHARAHTHMQYAPTLKRSHLLPMPLLSPPPPPPPYPPFPGPETCNYPGAPAEHGRQ